jgi:hypothetical protein
MPQFKGLVEICFTNTCEKVKVTDVTGMYHPEDNPTGWYNFDAEEGEEGYVALTEFDTIYLEVYDTADPDELLGTIILRQGAFSAYPESDVAEADMVLGEFDWPYGDGVFDIYYIFESSDEIIQGYVQESFHQFYNDCAATNCVNALWLKYFQSCNTNDQVKDMAMEAEALLMAAKAAAACVNTIGADKINEVLTKICEIADCDCGCS